MMRNLYRIFTALIAGSVLATSAYASGPRFGTSGGIGSATSTYNNGELTGGAYSINGLTGTATFNGVVSPDITTPETPVASVIRPSNGSVVYYQDSSDHKLHYEDSLGNSYIPALKFGMSDFSSPDGIYVNYKEGTTGQTWYVGKSVSGNIPGNNFGPTNSGYSSDMFQFDVRHDSAKVTNGDFLRTFETRDVVDGSGWTGGRIASLCELLINTPSDSTNINRNYQCAGLNTHVTTGDGGTAPTMTAGKGSVFGFGAALFLHTGAVNLLDADNEVDDYAQTGTSVALKSAMGLVNYSQIHGSVLDAGLRITGGYEDGNFNTAPSIGWTDMIALTDSNGNDPFSSNSDIIAWKPIRNTAERTLRAAFDLRGIRFTDNILQSDYVNIGESGETYSSPQAIISLTNGTREYQLQAVTSGDYFRIIAGNSGDILHITADGKMSLPQSNSSLSTTSLNLTETTSSSISTPASGTVTYYQDSSDHKLHRIDSSGTNTVIG